MHVQRWAHAWPFPITVVACAAAATVATLLIADGMGAAPGTMGLGLPSFLGVWAVMMTAMMAPSVWPVAGLYLRRLDAEPRAATRAVRTTALMLGYLSAWLGFGVVAFGFADLGGWLADQRPDQAPYVAAGGLALAGLYQLTPLKDLCLRHCRSPLVLFLRYSGFRGRARDYRVGLHHGAYCVGCCWGLMLVLLVVGVMNIGWMVLIAAIIALEKLWRHGRRFSLAVGVLLIVLAMFVPAHPELAPGLHPAPMSGM